jgi:hypothetical protein
MVPSSLWRGLLAGALALCCASSFSDECNLTCRLTNFFRKKEVEGTEVVERFFKADNANGCRSLWWDELETGEEVKVPSGTTVLRPIFQQLPAAVCEVNCVPDFERGDSPSEIEVLSNWLAYCAVPEFSAFSSGTIECYIDGPAPAVASCVDPPEPFGM